MGLSPAIKQRALEIGFDLVGIAPVKMWDDLDFSRRWVEQGFGGEMHYLANPKRDDPRQLLASAKSVVCVGLIYNAPLPYSTEVQKAEGSTQKSAGRGQERQAGAEVDTAEGSRQLPVVGGQMQKPEDKTRRGMDYGHADKGPRGWVSRYAWGEDYHRVVREKLEQFRVAVERLAPGAETRVYVDTGPVVERALARYSGIGWVGKNTCLIDQEKGSWFFLGVMLTSVELEPDFPAPDRCGSCTRCIEACPTGALVQPYVMDASRCIAYFTIELKGSIPEEFRPAIGNHLFGCDICQDVCPWNRRSLSLVPGPWSASHQPLTVSPQRRGAATTNAPEFQPLQICKGNSAEGTQPRTTDHGTWTSNIRPSSEFRVSLFNPSLEDLASLSEEDFRRVFARSPVKRAKYRGWLRNLCVTMGNSGDGRFVAWLERARDYPDLTVREHAEWALRRLAKTQSCNEDGL